MKKLINFFKEEDGATAPEYAVMVALIAAVVIFGAGLLGTAADTKFQNVASSITAAGS